MEVRFLPVTLSKDELAIKADELARGFERLKTLEAEKKDANADFKMRIEIQKSEVARLSGVVSSKSEMREVECRTRKNYELGVVETVRVDTDEVVETRAMDVAERQASFAETL